jgi:hypothetical protein
MKPLPTIRHAPANMEKQRGLVLFFALIALVVMSLAAVALIRSVDTSTMIAGNIAFKQSTTASGDAGIEAAIAWLSATEVANSGLNIYLNPAHPFNVNDVANGYYTNADPNLNLFADATWNDVAGTEIVDNSNNQIRYIIQRMCRTANALIRTDDCLFSGAILNLDNNTTPIPQEFCSGPGCPVAGQTPQIRITTRTIGAKNTVSYLQAFVY